MKEKKKKRKRRRGREREKRVREGGTGWGLGLGRWVWWRLPLLPLKLCELPLWPPQDQPSRGNICVSGLTIS